MILGYSIYGRAAKTQLFKGTFRLTPGTRPRAVRTISPAYVEASLPLGTNAGASPQEPQRRATSLRLWGSAGPVPTR